MGESASQC